MRSPEHLVLCGGEPGKGAETLLLDLRQGGNVCLQITDIGKRLVANIPDVLVDLLEIAAYVYAADSALPRGGTSDARLGERWRRKLRFDIPVRLPALWSSQSVRSAMSETLGFLSEDEYAFEFRPLRDPAAPQSYFEIPVSETGVSPDEVVLFSGGLDSFAGAVDLLAKKGTKVALVSHRSSPVILKAQKDLVLELRRGFGADRVLHIPVRLTLRQGMTEEATHRSRSFLFACLGAVVARLFGRNRILFYENGVVSLNLPPVAQVVGARATRTTHPQALAGFRRVLSAVLKEPFDLENPFAWKTKAEVVERIAFNGRAGLIRHTRSCTRVRSMTILHPHCGCCSQCIDRRFGVLAAGQGDGDPAEAYAVDLFDGSRRAGPDREMALSYVRSATRVNTMPDIAFFSHYGEASRVIDHFPEAADAVAGRVYDLHRRHAAAVCRVFDEALKARATDLREGTLPRDCLLILGIGRKDWGEAITPPVPSTREPAAPNPWIMLAVDRRQNRVIVDRWGELKGKNAALVMALIEPFQLAVRSELSPEGYPFTSSPALMDRIDCVSDEVLRRIIFRCRRMITALATGAGIVPPPPDAVIESNQGHGYRLNPDRVHIVAIGELRDGPRVTPQLGKVTPRRQDDGFSTS